ncbi:MAG: NUDIX hydrolase [Euryarchaeota archaeon]|nr:NUDIX hydrolase [Euryarchaeota archaeon]
MRKAPALAVDIVIEVGSRIVLIRRRYEPFAGSWALPGGFVECGERVEEAAVREAREETNLNVEVKELLGVYSAPERDPRGHVVSICFIARGEGELRGRDDAAEAGLFSPREALGLSLAFDHAEIIKDYLRRKHVLR